MENVYMTIYNEPKALLDLPAEKAESMAAIKRVRRHDPSYFEMLRNAFAETKAAPAPRDINLRLSAHLFFSRPPGSDGNNYHRPPIYSPLPYLEAIIRGLEGVAFAKRNQIVTCHCYVKTAPLPQVYITLGEMKDEI